MTERRLAPLGALDPGQRAAGAPDVRGWDVIAGTDGRRIGRVAKLLGEPGGGRARYLDVRLDAGSLTGGAGPASPAVTGEQLRAEERGLGAEHAVVRDAPPVGGEILGDENPADGAGWDSKEIRRQARQSAESRPGAGERHALVPVGRARLDRRHRQVIVEGLASVDAASLPEYRPGEATAAVEEETARRFAGLSGPGREDPLSANHGLFDEDRFYGAQRGAGPAEPAGDVRDDDAEPAEAGLRPDTSGRRHERDINPRR